MKDSNDEINDKERVEAYLRLAELHYQKYKDRRDLEWRVHILIWTLIASIGAIFVSSGSIYLEGCEYFLIASPIFFIHFFWTVKIIQGQVYDMNRCHSYRDRADKILFSEEDVKELKTEMLENRAPDWLKDLWKNWPIKFFEFWIFIYMITTFGLLYAVYQIILRL